jgi:hypothetical protein
MRVRHTVATALAGILLVQSAGMAQTQREPAVRPIPREQALQILLSHLQWGSEVRVEVAGGANVVGQFVETRDDEVLLLVSGQPRAIPVAEVISISRPLQRGTSASGKSFAVGAAAGTGLLLVVILIARAAIER